MTKPNWKPQKIKLGQIQAWDNNPRMSTKAQAQRIIASERKFGQPVPFLVAPEVDGRFLLYDGHQRLAAWFTVYGADYEMDAMVADRPLTEAEHKELIITLHTGATGSWNWDNLSSWNAGDLQEWGMNGDALKSWNNDANNLKELLTAEVEPVDAEPQTDRAGELAEKWQTASGQLWKLGDHRLLIGDCTVRENVERLMEGEKIDCVFTSPPYNQGGKGKRLSPFYGGEGDERTKDEYKEFLFSVLSEMAIICNQDASILWNVMYNANSRDDYGKIVFSDRNPFLVQETIIWDKGHGFNVSTKGILSRNSEIIFLMSLGDEYQTNQGQYETWFNTWKIGTQGSQTEGHGAAFPLELAEMGIDKFCTGSIVYEPFCGTGTTILAAHNLGRKCYSLELSEKYGAVILQRFLDATGIQPELVE